MNSATRSSRSPTTRWERPPGGRASASSGRGECSSCYGQSSGPVPPIDPLLLSQNGSLFITRPTLGDYAATPDELKWRAGEVLDSVASGKLNLTIDRELPLAQAAEAHRLLEGRATTGKLILRP